MDHPFKCDNENIKEALIRPADALGVITEEAIFVLQLFVLYSPFNGRDRSTLPRLCKEYDVNTLEWKLRLDREVLVDAVVPAHDVDARGLLRGKNAEATNRYFAYVGTDRFRVRRFSTH